MSLIVACPNCQTRYNLPQNFQGKKVKCKSCGKPFAASVGAARVQTKPAPTAKADEGQDIDPNELAKMGIGAIRPNADPLASPAHHGPDPLRNHVIQDPGFGLPGTPETSAQTADSSNLEGYEAVVSNPYIKTPKPSAHVAEEDEAVPGKKKKKRKKKVHPAVKDSLDKATMTLLIVGVIISLVCGLFFMSAYGDAMTNLTNINKFSVDAGGEAMTDAEMEEIATEEAYQSRIVWGIGVLLGVVFILLGVGVQIFPVTCIIVGMVLYIFFELFVCFALFDFISMGGWLRRFLVVGALGKAFMDALNARYYDQMMAERRASGR